MGSVQSQTFNSYEFIIINDGSTDTTLNEIKTMETSFINIKVVSYTENKGVNYARNRGIEQAQGHFIIFLDSDDWFAVDALTQINNTIYQNPGYLHYLFGVSDRINDKSLSKTIKEFQYKDWLAGNVTGDFAHVIQKTCFKDMMFIEKFRIYESLNWHRVLRKNQKQLFVPIFIFNRERGRTDSVTRESLLDNKKSMQNTYNYMYQFIEWYKDDFVNLNLSKLLIKHLKVSIIIGFAVGERNRNKYLIDLLNQSFILNTIFKISNQMLLQPIFFFLIKTKSYFNKLTTK
jgi:glycosyltransferase involved in cell wall biosynthesis